MFTGIIEEVGFVGRVEAHGDGRRFTIEATFAGQLRIDESVSVNGVCQTVIACDDAGFEVIAIEETLSKSALGRLREGDRVNLERAMRADARLDGHIVQGHVDTTGRIEEVEELSASHLFRIAIPERWRPYLIPTGSIAVDGISLTVARLGPCDFTVAIIPHTIDHTAIPESWRHGAEVNLEFDMIGKYVIRWLDIHGPPEDSKTTTP
jgi:riboflavin synthase